MWFISGLNNSCGFIPGVIIYISYMNIVGIYLVRYLVPIFAIHWRHFEDTTCLRYDYIISKQAKDFLEINDLR